MKKVLLVVLMVLTMAISAFALDNKITSNTVSFNTTPLIVTFNTIINRCLIINESSTDNLFVTFDGSTIGWNTDNTIYILPTNLCPAVKVTAGSSLSLDLSTNKIGLLDSSTGTAKSGAVTYVVTSDRAQP